MKMKMGKNMHSKMSQFLAIVYNFNTMTAAAATAAWPASTVKIVKILNAFIENTYFDFNQHYEYSVFNLFRLNNTLK